MVLEVTPAEPHWAERVVDRSLKAAQQRSIDRSTRFIRAAAKVLERSGGETITVQEVADEAGQSLRTLYQYFASKDDLLLALHEEAMRSFALMIRAAIDELTDPAERLAGALITSGRMVGLHGKAGMDRGLSRLRLKLNEADPALVARSQEPLSQLFAELVGAALAAEGDPSMSPERAAYCVSALRAAQMQSVTLGNEQGLELPDIVELSMFCLAGLGLARPRAWFDDVERRLALDGADGRSILRRLARSAR